MERHLFYAVLTRRYPQEGFTKPPPGTGQESHPLGATLELHGAKAQAEHLRASVPRKRPGGAYHACLNTMLMDIEGSCLVSNQSTGPLGTTIGVNMGFIHIEVLLCLSFQREAFGLLFFNLPNDMTLS